MSDQLPCKEREGKYEIENAALLLKKKRKAEAEKEARNASERKRKRELKNKSSENVIGHLNLKSCSNDVYNKYISYMKDIPQDVKERVVIQNAFNECSYTNVIDMCQMYCKSNDVYVRSKSGFIMEYLYFVCLLYLNKISESLSFIDNAWDVISSTNICYTDIMNGDIRFFEYLIKMKLFAHEVERDNGNSIKCQSHLVDALVVIMGYAEFQDYSKHIFFEEVSEKIDRLILKQYYSKIYYNDRTSSKSPYILEWEYNEPSELIVSNIIRSKRKRKRNDEYVTKLCTTAYMCAANATDIHDGECALNQFNKMHQRIILNYVDFLNGFVFVNKKCESNGSDSEFSDNEDENTCEGRYKNESVCTASTREEYFKQRVAAFQEEIKMRSVLMVCPCCGEERQRRYFSNINIFDDEVVPMLDRENVPETYGTCNRLVGGRNMNRTKISTLKMLEPLRKSSTAYTGPNSESVVSMYEFIGYLEVTARSNRLCITCTQSLKKNELPMFSWKNFPIKSIPSELSDLSSIETSLISKILPLVTINKTQCNGLKTKKFSINFRTEYNEIIRMLPRCEDDTTFSVMVMSEIDCNGHIIERVVNGKTQRPFPVRQRKVETALSWLVLNNIRYNDVIIDAEVMNELPTSEAVDANECFVEERLLMRGDVDICTNGNNVEEEIIKMVTGVGNTDAEKLNTESRNYVSINHNNYCKVATTNGCSTSILDAFSYFVSYKDSDAIRQDILHFIDKLQATNAELLISKINGDLTAWKSDIVKCRTEVESEMFTNIRNWADLPCCEQISLYLNVMYSPVEEFPDWFDNGCTYEYALAHIFGCNIVVYSSNHGSVNTYNERRTTEFYEKFYYFLCDGERSYIPLLLCSDTVHKGFKAVYDNTRTTVHLMPCKDIVSMSTTPFFMELAWPTLFPDGHGGPKFSYIEGSNNLNCKVVGGSIAPQKSSFNKYVKHLMRYYTRQFQNSKFLFWLRGEMMKTSLNSIATAASISKTAIDRGLPSTSIYNNNTTSLNAGHLRDLKLKNQELLSALRPYFNAVALRGSSVFWEEKRRELFSMLGSESMTNSCATFFLTLSSSDRCWPELFHMIDPNIVTIDGVWKREISVSEREKLLLRNPAIVAMHFYDRFEAFIIHVLKHKSKFNDIGDVTDFWFRFEFQSRGAIHGHSILFSSRFQGSFEQLKSPNGINNLTIMLEPIMCAEANYAFSQYNVRFINSECCCTVCENYCICDAINAQPTKYESVFNNPACQIHTPQQLNDPDMLYHINELVKVLQTHRCCFSCFKYCRGKKKNDEENPECRFHFPKELQNFFEIKVEEYTDKATGSKKFKHKILYKRSCDSDKHINPYHPLILCTWKANMDLQFIGNPYGACVYACKYCSKNEAADQLILTPKILKHIKTLQVEDICARRQLRKELSVFLFMSLGAREVSVQESMWHILGLPLVVKTRQIVKINALPTSKRIRTIKSLKQLNELADDDTNIFKDGPTSQDTIIRCYENRPCNTFEMGRLGTSANSCAEESMEGFLCPITVPENIDPNIYFRSRRIDFDGMSFSSFVCLFEIKKKKPNSSKKLYYEIIVKEDQYFITFRKRRPVVRLSPHIKINLNDGDSAFSILFLYVPFRNEAKLLGEYDADGNYVESACVILKNMLINNLIPDRIRLMLQNQLLIEEVNNEPTISVNYTNKARVVREYDIPDEEDDTFEQSMLLKNICTKELDHVSMNDDGTSIVDIARPYSGKHFTSNKDYIRYYDPRNTSNVLYDRVTEDYYEKCAQFLINKKNSQLGITSSYIAGEKVDRERNNYFEPSKEATEKLVNKIKTLNERQLMFIESFVTSLERGEKFCMFLSGQGGSGKSYCVEVMELVVAYISLQMRGRHAPIAKTAFTGTAASQIGGTHIHSLFRLRMSDSGKTITMLRNEDKMKLVKEFEDVSVLVIDEVSMLSLQLLRIVNDRLQIIYNKREPFGGLHVVFTGDYYQLPVIGGIQLYKREAYDDLMHIVNRYICLTEQQRTANIPFATALEYLRVGPDEYVTQQYCDNTLPPDVGEKPKNFAESLALINSRVVSADSEILKDVKTFGASRWSRVKHYNDAAIRNNSNKCGITVFAQHYLQSSKVLINNKNALLYKHHKHLLQYFCKKSGEEDANVDAGKLPPYITLREGDRVMVTMNVRQEINVTNGSMGTVVHLLYDKKYDMSEINVTLSEAAAKAPPLPIVLIRFDKFNAPGFEGIDNVVPIRPCSVVMDFSIDDRGRSTTEKVVRVMLPIIHSTAATIHKLQGFSCIDMGLDPEGLFARGQAYVGLSRATDFSKLYIIGKKLKIDVFKYGPAERNQIANEYRRLERIGCGVLNTDISGTMVMTNLQDGRGVYRCSISYVNNLIKRLKSIRRNNWIHVNNPEI